MLILHACAYDDMYDMHMLVWYGMGVCTYVRKQACNCMHVHVRVHIIRMHAYVKMSKIM